MESFLEVLVQDIKQTVCETPHEEEDGDERQLCKLVHVYVEQVIDIQE